MDDAQHSLQRKLEQERRHLACLCAGFALPHGHGDEADNARDEMAELLAWSHANLCAARIRALEGLLGDLRCSGRRLCMDCGEEIPLSRLLAVPGACRCRDCQQLAEEEPGLRPAPALAAGRTVAAGRSAALRIVPHGTAPIPPTAGPWACRSCNRTPTTVNNSIYCLQLC